jgi:catechol 2,3-dioxygenase-like lactoylglutathione lyase family enzyme
MLDHIGLLVSDYTRSKAFFEATLAPLHYKLIMEFGGATGGFGVAGKPDFWISQGEPITPCHVAFSSPDRATVDAFHEAAIAAGGRDNGAVHDPDGNNVEAVCHNPE